MQRMFADLDDTSYKKIILNLFSHINNLDEFAAFSLANSQMVSLARQSKLASPFAFFKLKYEFNPLNRLYLRKPEELSLPIVRAGNYFAKSAINSLLNTKDRGTEELIFHGAKLTGSPYLMQMANMLSLLPGRSSWPIFPKEQIETYKQNMVITFQRSYQNHFPQTDWQSCEALLQKSILIADRLVITFVDFYRQFYLDEHGIGDLNIEKCNAKWQEYTIRLAERIKNDTIPFDLLVPAEFNNLFNVLDFFNFQNKLKQVTEKDWFYSAFSDHEAEKNLFLVSSAQTGKAKTLNPFSGM